jgi:dipeptide/tripeptide permease
MFSWFYWMINIGALSSIITTNIEKYHSFSLAYLLPLLVFTGSIIVLVIGRNQYIKKPPNGSLLIRAGRLIVTATQVRWRLGKQQQQAHILDYAKDTVLESNHNQFIEELKQALRACRVFCFYPFYWLAYGQLSNNMISQAAQMNVGKSVASHEIIYGLVLPKVLFPMIFCRTLILLF